MVSGGRADLRAIDGETALRILRALDSYLSTGVGDVKRLQPLHHEFRLRLGDYRVLSLLNEALSIEILRVLHRKDAYR